MTEKSLKLLRKVDLAPGESREVVLGYDDFEDDPTPTQWADGINARLFREHLEHEERAYVNQDAFYRRMTAIGVAGLILLAVIAGCLVAIAS